MIICPRDNLEFSILFRDLAVMVVGHERILGFLNKILERKIPIHGFLFAGPEGVGKKFVATLFAKGILCENSIFGGCRKCASCKEFLSLNGSHRDFLLVESKPDEPYGIETSRVVISFLSSQPQLSQRQVVILDNADELSDEAKNALLKILEEPPKDAVIILVTSKPAKLPETIRSR
ncbi:MAG: AAA family ATPase, partial [Candidatus Paceibacteria bacterium]